MTDEIEQQVEKESHIATEMVKLLLEKGGTPLDMIDTMARLTGMVACGLAFSVKGDMKLKRKAYQVQQDLAKATRKSIEKQNDESFELISFESMFIEDEIH